MRRITMTAMLLAGLVLVAPSSAAEEPRTLYRAATQGAAIHGFYDHEGLFPVPILNASVPYTEAAIEPGPSSRSLGSFLWNPQAAELGTILCVLSEGELCEVPEYPFQARASYPAAGPEDPPPTLTIDEPGSPLEVLAAHERAEAAADGAVAVADVARFAAIPMAGEDLAAARSIALASPLAPAIDRWLISIGGATSRSAVTNEAGGVLAETRAVLHDVELLGGLIHIETVRGETLAGFEERPRGKAASLLQGVSVAGVDARVTPRGITIDDAGLSLAAIRPLQDALDSALERAGMRITPGRERVLRADDEVSAEAFALTLELRGRVVPEQLPEGTQGRDVVRLPLGFASAEAEVAQIVAPPSPPPQVGDAPSSAGGGGILGVGGGEFGTTGGADLDQVAAPPPPPPAVAAPAEPALSLSNLGVSGAVIAGVLGAALLLALGLTWLRVNEVLHE